MIHNKFKELNIYEIESIIKKIKQLGIQYIYLQGGEPTSRKDIVPIMELMLKHNLKPTLITNGSLLNKELIDFIKDRDINLAITILTLDSKKHYILTGNKTLNRTLQFIESLRYVEHKVNWSITTTITKISITATGRVAL